MFDRKPCVYLVGREYQIVFNTKERGIAWVEVNHTVYPDEENGLMRSETTVHRAHVPTSVLDEARQYVICFRPLPERVPYFPQTGPVERQAHRFRPIDWNDGLQIYLIADAHSYAEPAIEAGRYFGSRLDLLILGGDIPAESKTERDVLSIFDIAGGITGGERPVLFARGNHDTRGRYALELPNYIGADQGRTYFTFRSGALWGVVLDCGEDKWDTYSGYGGLVCCHPFRKRQTQFLRDILARADQEFAAPGVKVRLAVCHVPFCTDVKQGKEKFDIEQDIFAEWTALLNQMKIDCMLCGHDHRLNAFPVGSQHLRYGARFPVLIGAEPHLRSDDSQCGRFIGSAFETHGEEIHIDYTDNRGWKKPAMHIRLRR